MHIIFFVLLRLGKKFPSHLTKQMALRAAAFFLFLLATPAVYAATTHVVGDSNGWNTGVNYDAWAAAQTFNVGDTLLFNYDSSHGVDIVSQDDYNNCNTGNALQSFKGGKTSITLSQPGPMYFVCPTMFHCGGGMKLSVNVGGSGGGSTPSSTATPTTTIPTSTTLSPASKSSPSSTSGAIGSFGSISLLVLGALLVFFAAFAHI